MTLVRFGILMALVIKQVKGDRKSEESRMRVSKEKAAFNREEILTSAARLFREHGIDATGVDAITEDAGLTHGGLYSQFGSKQAIVTEAIRFALARSRRGWQQAAQGKPGNRALSEIVAAYMSQKHRDSPGQGCLVAALSGDIARQPEAVREAFTGELKGALALLAGLMAKRTASSRYDDAIAVFACMVGAVTLARAVNDETLSRRMLKAAAKRVGRVSKVRRPVRRRSKANARTRAGANR